MKKTYVPQMLVIFLCSIALLFSDARFEEHVIMQNIGGACGIAAADFNLDGNQDIVYTCFQNNRINWLENDGNLNFTSHTVIENFLNAKAIDTGDIDQDGYPDFAATSYSGSKISWFHNNGNGAFTENVLTNSWQNPGWVLLTDSDTGDFIDINSDGAADILATDCQVGRFGWFENDGNQNFTEHIIKDNWQTVSGAVACDLDSDNDTDILVAAHTGGFVWFENTGDDDIFVEHLIFNGWDQPNWVQAGDINNDGFMDFAATSCGTSDCLGWFENDGYQNFTLHLLRDNFGGARSPIVSDIDDDGDKDIFGIAWNGAIASFFDNDGEENFTEYTICTTGYDLLKFFVVDLDGDNDKDLIGSTDYGNNHIRWWENIDEFLTADFTFDSASGHLPLTVNFREISYSKPLASLWQWDFDNDGNIDSTEPNPVFTYNSTGNYDVNLTISNGIETLNILKEDCIRIFAGESAIEYTDYNSHLTVPAAVSLNLISPFTLEAWLSPAAYGYTSIFGNGMIFHKTKISIYLSDTFPLYNEHCLIIKFSHADGTASCVATPANSIILDEWQHLAITYDGNNDLQVYLNGENQELTIYTATSGFIADNATYDLHIGNNGSMNSGFAGVIDEVRIWTTVRTQTEINEYMTQYVDPSSTNLAGYWRLNEGSGSQASDLTSQANNGTVAHCRWHAGTPFITLKNVPEIIPQTAQISLSNFPNPFNPSTTISFSVAQTALFATIEIYNIKGQKVKTLDCIRQLPDANARDSHSKNSIIWDGTDQTGKSLSSGIYFYCLQANGKLLAANKMILLK
ncbi:MAG TPA: FG-GAP-like repeat-containing protein [Candidatus Cloacimonadota bacterium]|nr:FG-GAP-like repeat-containing protein [Candidatus Cloacimonadota bacterium]